MRLHCQIVGIEGTAKERHYTVRELCISDLADPIAYILWALAFRRVFVVITY